MHRGADMKAIDVEPIQYPTFNIIRDKLNLEL
jgi:hypothetical protein